MKRYYLHVIVTALVCLSIGVYWNSLNNHFVNMDDQDLIVRNKYIKALNFQNIKAIFTPGVVGAYQPVRTLSYALDYHFWKLNPMGYHITNIFCHTGSTLLVFLIAYMLAKSKKSPLEVGQTDIIPLPGGARGGFLLERGQGDVLPTAHSQLPTVYACLASLFFAIHPVHVEAVTWLSGRRDVLSSIFALLSFYCFLQFLSKHQKTESKKPSLPEKSRAESPLEGGRGVSSAFLYILSLLLFVLGLLTKSSVVVLPFLLILYDVCFLLPPLYKKGRRMLYYIPFCLVDLVFIIVFVSHSRTSGVARAAYHGGSAYTTFLTMLRVFAEYISMLFVPRNLSLTYGVRFVPSIWDLSFLAAIGVLTIVFVLTLLAWKRATLVFFGVCWFFIGLIPVSNIIPIGIVKADRYLYLPSVGFYLVLSWLIVRGWTALTHQRSAKSILQKSLPIIYWLMAAIMVFSYASLTVRRNWDWKDSETLWTATLETTPTSTIALNNLGLIYAERGLYDKALALYEQLLDYNPDQHHVERVYANMASAYTGKQMFDKAIDYYQKALEIDPEYEGAYLGLGKVSMELGQYDKAARIYQLASELNPQSETIYNQLGNLSFVQGNYDEAIAHYRTAIELNPFYITAYNGLGLSYAEKGEIDNAQSIYHQALHINPDSTVIRNSLGSLYMNQGKTEKAISEFTKSLQQEPNSAEVRNNLGMLLLRTRQYEKALRELMAALKLQPDNPKIMTNLGIAYTYVGLYEQAIQMYRWALQIDPSLFRTHILLGDVCFGTKDFSCTIEAYQKALEFQPDNQELLERLRFAKEQQSKHEK